MQKPLILLSNDDGVSAPGLHGMRAALTRFADVVVCAPAGEQSAQSHSISLGRPLRLSELKPRLFSLDGTPADCVYVALHAGERVLPRRPDLVVSGLNHGLNLGNDVFYSGTVAAAREAAFRGITALACSRAQDAELVAACSAAATFARRLCENKERTPDGLLLNLNVPPGTGWPVKATTLGERQYEDRVDFRLDPRDREYLWIGGGGIKHAGREDSDVVAYDQGCVSVTPLSLNLWQSHQAAFVEALVKEVNAVPS